MLNNSPKRSLWNMSKRNMYAISILVFFVSLIGVQPLVVHADEIKDMYKNAELVENQTEFDAILKKENNIFITNGTVTSKDSVSYEYSDEEYLAVYKVKETYEKRTIRTVTMAGKTPIPISSTHWTWTYDSETAEVVNTINIMNHEFDADLFTFPTETKSTYYYDKNNENVRYYYKVTPKEFNASFIAKVSNNGIESINKTITLQKDMSATELQEKGQARDMSWFVVLGMPLIILVFVLLVKLFE